MARFKFIVTRNFIENTEKERTDEQKKYLTRYFEVFDDDGELYFIGYSNDSESEDAFIPMDAYQNSYGCTYIKYRNRDTGKMEIL